VRTFSRICKRTLYWASSSGHFFAVFVGTFASVFATKQCLAAPTAESSNHLEAVMSAANVQVERHHGLMTTMRQGI